MTVTLFKRETIHAVCDGCGKEINLEIEEAELLLLGWKHLSPLSDVVRFWRDADVSNADRNQYDFCEECAIERHLLNLVRAKVRKK